MLSFFDKLLLSGEFFHGLSFLFINLLKLSLFSLDLLLDSGNFLFIGLNLHVRMLSSKFNLVSLFLQFHFGLMKFLFFLLDLFGGLGLRLLTLGK
jgi:hypothetical protein